MLFGEKSRNYYSLSPKECRQYNENMSSELEIGDIIRLRKKHPCGSYDWQVVRLGVDIGLICQGCARRIMLPRSTVNKRMKAIISKSQGFDGK